MTSLRWVVDITPRPYTRNINCLDALLQELPTKAPNLQKFWLVWEANLGATLEKVHFKLINSALKSVDRMIDRSRKTLVEVEVCMPSVALRIQCQKGLRNKKRKLEVPIDHPFLASVISEAADGVIGPRLRVWHPITINHQGKGERGCKLDGYWLSETFVIQKRTKAMRRVVKRRLLATERP